MMKTLLLACAVVVCGVGQVMNGHINPLWVQRPAGQGAAGNLPVPGGLYKGSGGYRERTYPYQQQQSVVPYQQQQSVAPYQQQQSVVPYQQQVQGRYLYGQDSPSYRYLLPGGYLGQQLASTPPTYY